MNLPWSLQPLLVVRLVDSSAECATWQVQGKGKALAVFSDSSTATKYQQVAGLSSDWQIIRPPREGLRELLRLGKSQGIELVAVDPDHEQAKHVIRIADILAMLDSLPSA